MQHGKFRSCQARAQARLLHRSRRTHRVPLRVQQDYESDDSCDQESGDRGDPHQIENKLQNQDNNQATRDRLRDLPEWLEDITENLQDTEMPAPAHFSGLRFRTSFESGIWEAQYFYFHFPRDRNCELW